MSENPAEVVHFGTMRGSRFPLEYDISLIEGTSLMTVDGELGTGSLIFPVPFVEHAHRYDQPVFLWTCDPDYDPLQEVSVVSSFTDPIQALQEAVASSVTGTHTWAILVGDRPMSDDEQSTIRSIIEKDMPYLHVLWWNPDRGLDPDFWLHRELNVQFGNKETEMPYRSFGCFLGLHFDPELSTDMMLLYAGDPNLRSKSKYYSR